jgi:hypothetical protein
MHFAKHLRGFIRRFTGWGDTEYLLRSAANAAALRESIEQLRRGEAMRYSPDEFERGLDFDRRLR